MIEYALAGAAAALFGYASLVERTAISLTRLELKFSQLPRAFDGFTILQLSDMHVAHWWTIERRMEEIVRNLDVDIDLLALAGDIAASSKGTRLVREFLDRVRPGRETYAIYGNSEHKGRFGQLRRKDLNWDGLRLLTNEHVVIERGSEKIVVAGVDDPFTKHDDLSKALEGAPGNAFKVLLAHTPDISGEAADAGVGLVLAGHTHGGQVRLPLVGAVYDHLHKYRSLVQGLFEGEKLSRILGRDAGEMRVYVSRGIGISNLPVRFLCPPEVVLITLRTSD